MSNPSDNLNGGNPMAGGPAWSPAAFNQMHGPVYQGSELELPCYGCSFPKAIARMYRKYFVFSGRASRSEFWWAYLYLCILNSVLYSAVVVAEQHHQETLALILDALILVLSLPLITLTFRRLHDTNRSGWWIFAPSIPSIAGIIVGLAIMYLTNRQFNDAMGAAAGGFTVMMIGFILDAVVWVWLLAGSSKPEGARFDKNSMVWVPGSSQVTPTNLGMQAGMTYQPMAPIPAPTASTTPMVPTAPTAQASGGNTMPAAAPNMQGTANPVAGVGVITGGQQFGVQTSASTPQSSDTPQFGNIPQIQMPDFGAPAQQLQAMQTAQAEWTVTPMPTPSTRSDGTFRSPAAPAQPPDTQPAAVSDQPAANQSASDQSATAQTTTDEANTTSTALATMPGVTFMPSSLGVPDMPAVKPQTVHGIQMPTGTYTSDADFSFMPDPQTPVMPTDPAQALQSVSFPTDEVHVPAQPQFPFTGQPTTAPTAPGNPGTPAIPTNFADFGASTTAQSPAAPTTPWDIPGQDNKHNQDSENSHNSQA